MLYLIDLPLSPLVSFLSCLPQHRTAFLLSSPPIHPAALSEIEALLSRSFIRWSIFRAPCKSMFYAAFSLHLPTQRTTTCKHKSTKQQISSSIILPSNQCPVLTSTLLQLPRLSAPSIDLRKIQTKYAWKFRAIPRF